ncbi:DUF4386 domain-containing protein [Fredinandcohnia humi]
MKNLINKPLIQRKYALTAGIALMVMAIAAVFSYGIVLGRLVIDGDAIATLDNIQSSIILFKAGIMGWFIILISDIVVSLSLYKFLKTFNKRLALLGAGLRLIYAGILGISILNLLFVMILTNNLEYFPTITIYQIQSLVMLFLNAFHIVWSIGLIFFGGHLMVIGYVTLTSSILPKTISILLLLASISYIIIHSNYTFFPNINEITIILESILSIPMFLGELSFAIWLLFKGGKIAKRL